MSNNRKRKYEDEITESTGTNGPTKKAKTIFGSKLSNITFKLGEDSSEKCFRVKKEENSTDDLSVNANNNNTFTLGSSEKGLSDVSRHKVVSDFMFGQISQPIQKMELTNKDNMELASEEEKKSRNPSSN